MRTKLRFLAWAAAGTVIVGSMANWVSGASTPEQMQVAQSDETEIAGLSALAVSPNATVAYVCSSACDIGAVFASQGSR